MNTDNLNLVRQALPAYVLSDDEQTLERQRITADKDLPAMEFLFRIKGKPCFPRRELVALAGKAKSGKTLFLSMLMACCLADEVLHIQHPFDDVDGLWETMPLRCLWYDTEQSEQSTQDILKNRVMHMIDGKWKMEDYFDVFNTRSLGYEDRLRLFELAVHKYHPDLVLLDGVRDLLGDINDGVKAQEIVERLMKLAQETNCCIVCVLHQNKGAEDRNLRGWIGTELTNKAFEVYACEKVKPDNIFVVEQTHTRKYDLDGLLFFRMDPETGLPVVCDGPAQYEGQTSTAGIRKEKLPPMNRDYIEFDDNNQIRVKKRELFYEVLKSGPLYYNDLQKRTMELLNCCTGFWNNLFNEVRDAGLIVRTKNERGKAIWKLPDTQSQQQTQEPRQLDLYPPDQA